MAFVPARLVSEGFQLSATIKHKNWDQWPKATCIKGTAFFGRVCTRVGTSRSGNGMTLEGEEALRDTRPLSALTAGTTRPSFTLWPRASF